MICRPMRWYQDHPGHHLQTTQHPHSVKQSNRLTHVSCMKSYRRSRKGMLSSITRRCLSACDSSHRQSQYLCAKSMHCSNPRAPCTSIVVCCAEHLHRCDVPERIDPQPLLGSNAAIAVPVGSSDRDCMQGACGQSHNDDIAADSHLICGQRCRMTRALQLNWRMLQHARLSLPIMPLCHLGPMAGRLHATRCHAWRLVFKSE